MELLLGRCLLILHGTNIHTKVCLTLDTQACKISFQDRTPIKVYDFWSSIKKLLKVGEQVEGLGVHKG